MSSILQRVTRRIRKRVRLTSHAASADAFLVSYPKSGRTWFRFILSHYFAAVAGGCEPVDLHNMFSIVPNYDLDAVRGVPAFRFANGQIPKILVSHLDYSTSRFLMRPVIMMVRDPRDVLVSAYFHATRHKHRFEGDIAAFIEDPTQGAPGLIHYLNGWAGGLKLRRHYILSYEDLSADPALHTRHVIEFLGRTVDDASLEKAVRAAQFDAMQSRERVEGIPAHDYDRGDDESLRMRRGKAGGFLDYLSEQQADRILELCRSGLSAGAKDLLVHTGLDLRTS